MSASPRFSIINKTKGRLPRLPFARIKEAVLGKSYTLELAFITPKESRLLNRRFRGKKKPANVLSFPFSKKEGQITIAPQVAKKQTRAYGFKTPSLFIGYLFIHGLLHLEGYAHGSKMESEEKRLYAKSFGKK